MEEGLKKNIYLLENKLLSRIDDSHQLKLNMSILNVFMYNFNNCFPKLMVKIKESNMNQWITHEVNSKRQ